MELEKPRIAVIGSGIAGQNGAAILAAQGASVDIFDLSERAGGHIHTVETPLGRIDQGAEIVCSSDATILKLCEKYGVKLTSRFTDEKRHHIAYFADGKKLSHEMLEKNYKLFAKDVADFQKRLRDEHGNFTSTARELDNISADTFLGLLAHDLDPDFIEVVKTVHRSDRGQPTSKQSALAFVEFLGASLAEFAPTHLEEDIVFKNGAESLISALKEHGSEQGVKTHLKTKLVGIDASKKPIPLTFETTDENGTVTTSVQEFDQVMIATQLYALRDVKGIETLGLTPEQKKLVDDGQYTNIVKLSFAAKGEPWHKFPDCCGDVVAAGSTFHQAWASHLGHEGMEPIVTMFVGADAANIPMPQLVAQCRAEYASVLGMDEDEVFAQKEPVSMRDWRASPCYAAPGVGQFLTYASFADAKLADNNVVFAGSYMPDGHKIGFMENGAISGQHAAEKLIAAWPKKPLPLPVGVPMGDAATFGKIQMAATLNPVPFSPR